MRLLPLAIFTSLVATMSVTASAEPRKRSDPAAADRRAGLAAFDVGDYAGAVDAFERAYRLDPDPRLLYNLGLAYRKKHEISRDRSDLVRARDAFVHFLSLARVDDPRFKQERKRLEKIHALAARYRDEIERQLAESEAPAPVPEDPPPAEVKVVAPAPPPARRRHKTASMALLIGGATTGIAAGVTGALALRDASSAEDLADKADHAGANRRAERADRLALASDVLLAATVVSVGVGAILWWRGRPGRVSPASSAGTVGLQVSF